MILVGVAGSGVVTVGVDVIGFSVTVGVAVGVVVGADGVDGVDGVDAPDEPDEPPEPDELPPVGPTTIPISSLDELPVCKSGLLPTVSLPARTTGATAEVVAVGVDAVVVLTTVAPLLAATPASPPHPAAALLAPTMFAWRPRRPVIIFAITSNLLPIILSILSINGCCRC